MDEPDTLRIEREGSVVRIEVHTEDDDAAMQLYDQVTEAARHGQIVLGVTLFDEDGEVA